MRVDTEFFVAHRAHREHRDFFKKILAVLLFKF
jgi:hypothetical protein